MAALLFIAAAWYIGWLALSRATGRCSSWQQKLFAGKQPPAFTSILTALSYAAGSLWSGLLFMTWIIWLLTYFYDRLLPNTKIHPLIPINIIVLAAVFIIVAVRSIIFVQREHAASPYQIPLRSFFSNSYLAKALRQISRRQLFLITGSIIFFTAFASWLMLISFKSDGSTVSAGYSVFSDFAPHTAVISSFSQGQNWPAQYPHFAGDGMSYHFLFFFLCANLIKLGLSISASLNLLSILGMISALILLGTLAAALTKRLSVFLLAPLLTLARSSFAIFTYLQSLYEQYGWEMSAWFTAIKYQRTFIGNTPRDEWGLWTVNVYANQRHLMPALAIMLLIILLFLPTLKTGRSFAQLHRGWLGDTNDRISTTIFASVILSLMAYWHGSALIATLAVLAVMALFSRAKLHYLITALAAVIGSLIQLRMFTSNNTGGIGIQWFWGFIAEDKSIGGVLRYLLELTGILLPLVLIIFFFAKNRSRVMITASCAPLAIAFVLSLTPDVTVNHKYVMISLMLLNIWLADLLARLWLTPRTMYKQHQSVTGRDRWKTAASIAKVFTSRLSAILICLIMTCTGFVEWHIFANANQGYYTIEYDTPVNNWIIGNTERDAVFIAAPWHYHSFFLTGRLLWLGHSYYAWSAGHDTGDRLAVEQQILSGQLKPAELEKFAVDNNIDFVIFDNSLRQHDQFTVNEDYFAENFTTATVFNDQEQTIIYSLRTN
ncbi:MAG: hypothetical protein PHD23_02500 [Eubacteriales bacterium]|nr:hypothetical protein [Eubacteriales bacterium]